MSTFRIIQIQAAPDQGGHWIAAEVDRVARGHWQFRIARGLYSLTSSHYRGGFTSQAKAWGAARDYLAAQLTSAAETADTLRARYLPESPGFERFAAAAAHYRSQLAMLGDPGAHLNTSPNILAS